MLFPAAYYQFVAAPTGRVDALLPLEVSLCSIGSFIFFGWTAKTGKELVKA